MIFIIILNESVIKVFLIINILYTHIKIFNYSGEKMKKILFVILFIIFFQYPAFGSEHLVQTKNYLWIDSTQVWDFTSRTVTNYYDNGLRKETLHFDSMENDEIPILINEYTYDENGNVFEHIQSTYDEAYLNNRKPSYKTTYSYNETGQMIVENHARYDKWSNPRWVDLYQWEYEYEDGKLISKTYLKEKGNGLENDSRTLIEYDENDNAIEKISAEWYNSTWKNTERVQMAYNDNNLLVEEINSKFEYDNWIPDKRYSYTYDIHKNKNSELWQNYDTELSSWRIQRQIIYNFDDNDNMLSEFGQTWDYWENVWNDSYRHSFNYNRDNQLVNVVYQLNTGGIDKQWINWLKIDYEYSSATDIEDPAKIVTDYKLFNNYPNPFNPSTKITYSIPQQAKVSLTIHSITGEKVATLADGVQSPGQHNITFDAKNLSSGIYFYKLQADNYIEVKKMILMK